MRGGRQAKEPSGGRKGHFHPIFCDKSTDNDGGERDMREKDLGLEDKGHQDSFPLSPRSDLLPRRRKVRIIHRVNFNDCLHLYSYSYTYISHMPISTSSMSRLGNIAAKVGIKLLPF